jgi:hypothetical protein
MFSALTTGMMECWDIGMLGLDDWGIGVMEKRCFFSKKVLTNNCMKCYYSIIPPFHYSWLEDAEWLDGNSLLSTICRISNTLKRG